MENRYNGWANYETWCLALWLDNDEGSQGYWAERAAEAYRDAMEDADNPLARSESAAAALAETLQDEIEENAPKVAGFYADVLAASLRVVNWQEIAANWVETVKDEEEYEDSIEKAKAHRFAVSNQGYDGTYADWICLPPEVREEYEVEARKPDAAA